MRWAAGALVGIVLLAAGVAKLTSRGWPGQADSLGAPSWAIRLTPFVEIVIGAALVAGVDYAAVAAIALLVAFTVLLVRALARGEGALRVLRLVADEAGHVVVGRAQRGVDCPRDLQPDVTPSVVRMNASTSASSRHAS